MDGWISQVYTRNLQFIEMWWGADVCNCILVRVFMQDLRRNVLLMYLRIRLSLACSTRGSVQLSVGYDIPDRPLHSGWNLNSKKFKHNTWTGMAQKLGKDFRAFHHRLFVFKMHLNRFAYWFSSYIRYFYTVNIKRQI